jgi:uncharacterized protein (TIRG00374 family)
VTKRIVLNVLMYLLAFGLLGWLVYSNWGSPGSNGLGDVWERHVVQREPIRIDFFLFGFVIYTCSVLLTLLRWYLLVRAQDLPFSVGRAMRLGMIGVFFNTFLPGSVGGDIIRAAALAKEQSRRTVAVATVLMDRVIALWGLIWFVAVLGGIFWTAGMLDEGTGATQSKVIVRIAGIVVGATVAVWVALGFLPPRRAEIFAGRLSRIPKVGASVAELWRAVWMYRSRPMSIVVTLALSWVGHVGFVTSFYCFARTLWIGGDDNPMPTLTQHFLLVPIGLVIQAMPLFPGGVGIGEAGFGGLYRVLAGERAFSNGVLGALVQRVVCWTIGMAGFVVFVIWLLERRRAPTLAAPQLAAAPVHATEPAATGIVAGENRWGTMSRPPA